MKLFKYCVLMLIIGMLLSPISLFSQIVPHNNSAFSSNGSGTNTMLTINVPAGDDRLIIAYIGTSDLSSTPTISYNGMAMTLACSDTDAVNACNDTKTLIYYLELASGGAIPSTTGLTVSGLSDVWYLGANSYGGIDQTAPFVNCGALPVPNTTNNSATVTASGVVSGNLLVALGGAHYKKQFDWGGPYLSNTNLIAINSFTDDYYSGSSLIATDANDQDLTFELLNSKGSFAGNLAQFMAAVTEAELRQNLLASDPCDCNNDQSENGAMDGTFSEQVVLEGTAGLSLEIGPGSTGIPLAIGSPIAEDLPANPGTYILNFDHADGVGYTLFVVDDMGQPIEDADNPGMDLPPISNVCYYPIIETSFPATECAHRLSTDLDDFVNVTNNGYSEADGAYTFSLNGNLLAGSTITQSMLVNGQNTISVTFAANTIMGTSVLDPQTMTPPCPSEFMATLIIEKVGCGNFPWTGN